MAVAAMAALVIAAVAALPAPTAAQQWSLEGQAGRLDFRLAPDASPAFTSMAVALGYDAPATRFRLTTGVPTAPEEPFWGAVDSWQRLAMEQGPLKFGVDIVGQGFVQRYTTSFEETVGTGPFQRTVVNEGETYGYGAAGQVMPLIALDRRSLLIEARAGVAGYRGGLGDDATRRDMPMADLRLTATPIPALAVGAEGRWYGAPDGDRAYTGLTALVARREGALWVTAGHWFADTATVLPWGVGTSLRLAERVDLMAYVRQDDIDPLYGTAPRRYWGAGLRVALTAPPEPARPVPASYDAGVATIALDDARSDQPRIAGDFNDWTPEPMVWRDGLWTYTARLEPGVYEYAFVDRDGKWYVPRSVPGRRDDGMGGYVAILVVEEPAP